MKSSSVLPVVCFIVAVCVLSGHGDVSASQSGVNPALTLNEDSPPSGSEPNDGLDGDSSTRNDGHDETVKSKVTQFTSVLVNPVRDPERAHPDHPGSGVLLAAWPGPNDARCAQKRLGTFTASGTRRPAVCHAAWVCGGERIDHVVSGRIAGRDVTGRYAEFLTGVLGLVGTVGGLADVDSVNDFLLERGLGGEHADDQIPVFYWCGKKLRGSGTVTLEIVSSDPARWPRLGWETTVDAEYDIPGLRDDALIALETEIGLNKPELAAVPPIDGGFTWVKWPTWLWVASDTSTIAVFDENSVGTMRLDMRAVVDRVDWFFDGRALQTCTVDQMLAYDKQTHDPVADAPECTHRFTDTVSGDLTATIYYNVEEKVRYRADDLGSYPDTPWVPHPDPASAQIDLSTVVPDYAVREILSVNTPVNLTDEEIAELLDNE